MTLSQIKNLVILNESYIKKYMCFIIAISLFILTMYTVIGMSHDKTLQFEKLVHKKNVTYKLLTVKNISDQIKMGILLYQLDKTGYRNLTILTNNNLLDLLVEKEYFNSYPTSPFKNSEINFNKDLTKIYFTNVSPDFYLKNTSIIKGNRLSENIGYENESLFYRIKIKN